MAQASDTVFAPPAGVNIIESAPPAPPPPPTSTILVSQMPGMAAPARGSGKAFEKLQQDLRKKAGANPTATGPAEPETAPVPQPEKATPGEAPTTETSGEDQEAGSSHSEPAPTPESEETPAPVEQPAPVAKEGKKEKANPWKVIDEYKQRTSKLESELAEVKKQVVPEQDRKTWEEKLTKTEARNKELEDEIRLHNYSKSQEFQEKFQKPYEDGFKRALRDLSEVTFQDQSTGQVRNLSGDDLNKIALMGFVQAKETAERMFPDFAQDVMTARKDIRALMETRQAALKEWSDNGSKIMDERIKGFQKQQQEIKQNISEVWKKVNSQALEDPKHGEFFKPKEGNAEWNQRLSKGFELVDRAYTENPEDPSLSAEQRAAVVKRHNAVRNRAASWGAVMNELTTLRQQMAEKDKIIASYKSSTPPVGGSKPANGASAAPQSASEAMRQSLRKLAHVA